MPAELAGRMRELVSAADLSPERRTAGVGIGSGGLGPLAPGGEDSEDLGRNRAKQVK